MPSFLINALSVGESPRHASIAPLLTYNSYNAVSFWSECVPMMCCSCMHIKRRLVFCCNSSITSLWGISIFCSSSRNVLVLMRHLQVSLFGVKCPILLLQHLDHVVHVHHLLRHVYQLLRPPLLHNWLFMLPRCQPVDMPSCPGCIIIICGGAMP